MNLFLEYCTVPGLFIILFHCGIIICSYVFYVTPPYLYHSFVFAIVIHFEHFTSQSFPRLVTILAFSSLVLIFYISSSFYRLSFISLCIENLRFNYLPAEVSPSSWVLELYLLYLSGNAGFLYYSYTAADCDANRFAVPQFESLFLY